MYLYKSEQDRRAEQKSRQVTKGSPYSWISLSSPGFSDPCRCSIKRIVAEEDPSAEGMTSAKPVERSAKTSTISFMMAGFAFLWRANSILASALLALLSTARVSRGHLCTPGAFRVGGRRALFLGGERGGAGRDVCEDGVCFLRGKSA